jgi:ribosome biogenesis GTPase / thiamine phosphate phosphatase
MPNRHIDLAGLGWSDWFDERAGLHRRPEDTVARVTAVDRDTLLLIDQTGQFRANLSGKYLFQHHQPNEFPCVGDWVCVVRNPADGFGIVHALLDRKTALRRRSAGESIEYQMIAANVDCVIIVQSCHYDFNLKRLERYLVMVTDGGAEPWVLLTKTDLVEPATLASQLADIGAAGITAPVLTLSNVTHKGVDELVRMLMPGKTYCFVGSSGVGKSTIINGLIGRERLETKEVSGTGEGRHTTVRRELIVIKGGALVIDNPGMREFGILGAASGIGGGFTDIISLAAGCRYRNCSHVNEPGCAVLSALEAGQIAREHYDNYIKLREESEFYEMTYAEKRKKDRDFGKFLKSVKKSIEEN